MLLIVDRADGRWSGYGRRHRRFVVVAAPAAHSAAHSAERARQRWLALAACLLPVLLGFLVAASVFLPTQVIQRGLLTGFDPDLLRHTLTTVDAGRDRDRDRDRARPCRRDRGARWCATRLASALPDDRGPGLCDPRHGAGARPAVAAGRDRQRHQCVSPQFVGGSNRRPRHRGLRARLW